MRFALMLEAAARAELRRPRRDRQACRGQRHRDALPLRPLPELPRTDRPADDRRLDGHGRPRPRHRPDRARRPGLAGHVPPSGQLRQGRHDRRRDERRPDRGRRGGRLERARAPPARAGVPADHGASRPDGGRAGHPPRSVGRAGRLVVRRPPGLDPRRAVPSQAGRRSGSAADGDRWRPARLLVGGQGSPRSYRLAARYADEFNLSSSGPEVAGEAFAAVDAACVGDRVATRRR